jgi:phosphocarrier protein HPr
MACCTSTSTRRMRQQEAEIINKLGLHARAAAKLTQLAAKYQCDVSLARNGRKVNAKSIMGVMMLAAGKGSRVTLETDGPDEEEAMNAIVALIGEYFGEGQ